MRWTKWRAYLADVGVQAEPRDDEHRRIYDERPDQIKVAPAGEAVKAVKDGHGKGRGDDKDYAQEVEANDNVVNALRVAREEMVDAGEGAQQTAAAEIGCKDDVVV